MRFENYLSSFEKKTKNTSINETRKRSVLERLYKLFYCFMSKQKTEDKRKIENNHEKWSEKFQACGRN